MKRSIIIVAVVVAAVLVPSALAKPTPFPSAASFYTPEALNAMGLRAQAQAQHYLTQGPSAARTTASCRSASRLRASTRRPRSTMGQRWTAQANYYLSQGSGVSPDDRVGIGIRGSGPTETVVPVSDDGFGSWDKVGIGLAGAAFALLLGMGLLLTVRRRLPTHRAGVERERAHGPLSLCQERRPRVLQQPLSHRLVVA